jgi:hypothetical protein
MTRVRWTRARGRPNRSLLVLRKCFILCRASRCAAGYGPKAEQPNTHLTPKFAYASRRKAENMIDTFDAY